MLLHKESQALRDDSKDYYGVVDEFPLAWLRIMQTKATYLVSKICGYWPYCLGCRLIAAEKQARRQKLLNQIIKLYTAYTATFNEGTALL